MNKDAKYGLDEGRTSAGREKFDIVEEIDEPKAKNENES
jgi:hypothetical protein